MDRDAEESLGFQSVKKKGFNELKNEVGDIQNMSVVKTRLNS